MTNHNSNMEVLNCYVYMDPSVRLLTLIMVVLLLTTKAAVNAGHGYYYTVGPPLDACTCTQVRDAA